MSIVEPRAEASHRVLPAYYNDLQGSLDHAWAMMVRGAADRRSGFHTPAVATVDEAGEPSQRVMVLRAVDPAQRTLRLHTDVRSQKFVHIGRQPRVSVLFYDAHAKLQLRIGARAEMHAGDEVARAAWAASRAQSRLCYEQELAPGAAVDAPLPELPVDRRFAAADDGQKNFAVLLAAVDRIEWLYLAIEGHRRARWAWSAGRWQGTWLAP
jgi:pyridoxamine 5'-phosphate oxidase